MVAIQDSGMLARVRMKWSQTIAVYTSENLSDATN